MGGNDDCLIPRHLIDQSAHLVLLVGIEPVGRLIEDQNLGIVKNRLGDTDAAFESLRQRSDGLVQHTFNIDLGRRLGDGLAPRRARNPPNVGNEGKQLQRCHILIKWSALGQVTDTRLDVDGVAADVEPANDRTAGRRRQEPGHHTHDGGLPRPVGTKETENLAAVHGEAHVVYSGDCPEPFA